MRGRSTERGQSSSHKHGRSKSRCKKNLKCYNCGKKGHLKKDYWSLNKNSNPQGNTKNTSEDRDALCCEASTTVEGGSVYSCNDHALEIVGVGTIKLKMYDGTIKVVQDVRHVKGLKKILLSYELLDNNARKIETRKGIMKFTVANTPQQNGVAERMNKTLLERTRAMLRAAGLEKSFWVEAVNTAYYLVNRAPSTAIELKTPMEMWIGKPADYSNLNVFESVMYVMYNSQEISKLDPKSRKCKFLGYTDGVKGMSPSNEEERIEMSRVPYASTVGSLMFAMIYTRPNIAQAVGVVSRYMENLGKEHWNTVKRILRYIKGTSNVALCYRGSNLLINGYVDSDYAGDLDKSKSTTGYVFKIVGGAVRCVSKLQSVVDTSTIEAEYVAATQASEEVIWLKMLLEELGHNQDYASSRRSLNFIVSLSVGEVKVEEPTKNDELQAVRLESRFTEEEVFQEGFFVRILKKMRFGERWQRWIYGCISFAFISVLVNGSSIDSFHLARGLRQGCPLSPILFNMVDEALNLMIYKAVEVGLFSVCIVGNGSSWVEVSHLQYANYLILFYGSSETQVLKVKRVLRVFELALGLELNLRKCSAFGINVNEEEVHVWAARAGCSVGSFPSTYLGVSLGTHRNSNSLWESGWWWNIELHRDVFDWEFEQWNSLNQELSFLDGRRGGIDGILYEADFNTLFSFSVPIGGGSHLLAELLAIGSRRLLLVLQNGPTFLVIWFRSPRMRIFPLMILGYWYGAELGGAYIGLGL
ncbi:hypothetical protein F3Y22_tig00110503pilonHSYRG00682 [Hibiscus syriacus]|uniref:Integrase catalytic domain-containing protein n=1 Tax=Hibiscus syriacus TaxID=106335 RepID=A0A6A3ADD0_HIBSY|nr:hypothetical protein F3Y22_tig00110503pilonHSYRG00682 [Hibiscus syriacus]